MNLDEEPEDFEDEDLEWEEEEEENIHSKAPQSNANLSGKKITIYFMSTIGPGEKKEKLNINDGNLVKDVKLTVGNLFALKPEDFHLSSGGITLDENKSLAEYNLANGDDVLLIPASIAGYF
ncbi:MAG: hypothetical protein JW891_15155 [Candidatus Lokiarchaeota archaeon]|nr:hypothetical protein [Candidatus Lokiarchaeota archaeon]